jgi:hypothetical protein
MLKYGLSLPYEAHDGMDFATLHLTESILAGMIQLDFSGAGWVYFVKILK